MTLLAGASAARREPAATARADPPQDRARPRRRGAGGDRRDGARRRHRRHDRRQHDARPRRRQRSCPRRRAGRSVRAPALPPLDANAGPVAQAGRRRSGAGRRRRRRFGRGRLRQDRGRGRSRPALHRHGLRGARPAWSHPRRPGRNLDEHGLASITEAVGTDTDRVGESDSKETPGRSGPGFARRA